MSDFEIMLEERASQVEEYMLRYLPKEEGPQKTVFSAMRYAMGAGGKRIRPILMREAFLLYAQDAFEDGGQQLLCSFMAALEMIHNSSLIHDDLPEMDNDDLRRGRPTCHKKYGHAMALLAGDGLLNLAFETTALAVQNAAPEMMGRAAKANAVLSRKAGTFGMLGGQVADVEAEGKPDLSMDQLLFIHEKKTSALLQAALMVGGILAGAPDEDVEALEKIGYDFGLAFQIRDDILDVTGDEKLLGKPVGSDSKNEKSTYVSMAGLEGAKKELCALSEKAKMELSALPGEHTFLEKLIDWNMVREK